MSRRNAQDFYNAQTIMWEKMRDGDPEPVEAPDPKPKRREQVVRRRDGKDTRVNVPRNPSR